MDDNLDKQGSPKPGTRWRKNAEICVGVVFEVVVSQDNLVKIKVISVDPGSAGYAYFRVGRTYWDPLRSWTDKTFFPAPADSYIYGDGRRAVYDLHCLASSWNSFEQRFYKDLLDANFKGRL